MRRAARAWLAPAWAPVIPVLLLLLCTLHKFQNTSSIGEDSPLFVRYAKSLGGEEVVDSLSLWRDRPAFARAIRENLHASLPTLGVVDVEGQHPGYPLLLLTCHRLIGHWCSDDPVWQWIRAGQIVSMFFGCLLVLGVYFLGRRLLGPGAGLTASLVIAICPAFASVQAEVLSDASALACLVFSTFHAVRLLDESRGRDAFFAGLWGALGYLIRPEGLLIALLLGMVLTCRLLTSRHGPRSRTAYLGVLLLIPIVMVCGSYVFLKWSLLTKSTSVLKDLVREAETSSNALLASKPFVPTYLHGVKRFMTGWAYNLNGALFLPVVLGLAIGWRSLVLSPSQRLIGLAAALNVLLLPGALFYVKGYLDHRHVMPVAVLTSLWCWPGMLALAAMARGVGAFLAKLRRADNESAGSPRPASTLLDPLLASFALALIVAFALGGTLSSALRNDRIGYRQAGEWLRGRLAAKETLLDPSGIACYFGDMQRNNRWTPIELPFPPAAFQALIRSEPSVAYVVVADHMISVTKLLNYERADGEPASPRLREVCSFAVSNAPGARHRVRILQVYGRQSPDRPKTTSVAHASD